MATDPYPDFIRYKILGVLGRGSMGTVYKAHHEVLGRIVALKVPRTELIHHQKSAERFLREARAMGMLDHPNIVKIYDADVEGDAPFLAMEYIEGSTLTEYIRSKKQLPVSEVIKIAVELADALAYLHGKGLLHRDLKSSNILLAPSGKAMVTDFGIAHLADQTRLTTGMLGTPAYMSPEQAQGHALDARSDLYSLGVVVFEMLSGTLPYLEDNHLALIQRILHEEVPAVDTYRSDVPVWLNSVLKKCLYKDPTKRYQSAMHLLVDLKESQANRPTSGYLKIDQRRFSALLFYPQSRQLDPITQLLQSPGAPQRASQVLSNPVLFFVVALWLISLFSGFLAPAPIVNSKNLTDEQMEMKADSSAVDKKSGAWHPWPAEK